MNEWSYTVDKVTAQSKTKTLSDIDKKVVNISNQVDKEENQSSTVETNYPELFKEIESRNEGRHPVLVPMHSSWFSTEGVHPIERRFFSALLTGQEEVQKYMFTRNTIFKLYQKNTSTYLSITQCRKCVSEDISTLIRIYSFLEHWGLINYKVGVKRDVTKMLEKIKHKDLFNIEKGSAAINTTLHTLEQTEGKMNSAADNRVNEQMNSQIHGQMYSKGTEDKKFVTVGESTIPTPAGSASLHKGPTDMLRDLSKHFSLQTNGVTPVQVPVEIECTSCGKSMHVLSVDEKIYSQKRGN